MQDRKKSSWPIPQPETTPRPVTTTRSASVADSEVDEDVGDDGWWRVVKVPGVKEWISSTCRGDDKMSNAKLESWNFILGCWF